MAEFASNAKGNAALTTGIIGTAGTGLALLGGGLGNLFGSRAVGTGVCACSEDHMINRYEAAQSARIAELETEVKLRDANTYTDQKILDTYQYVDGRLRSIEQQICNQNVYNATNTAAIACIQSQIGQLQSLTKLVVPNSSVCPGWGAVTVKPETTTAAAG